MFIYLLFLTFLNQSQFQKLGDLSSPNYNVRTKAVESLKNQEIFSIFPVALGLKSQDLQTKRSSERIYSHITKPYIKSYKHLVIFYLIFGPDEFPQDKEVPGHIEDKSRYLHNNRKVVKNLVYDFSEYYDIIETQINFFKLEILLVERKEFTEIEATRQHLSYMFDLMRFLAYKKTMLYGLPEED